VRASAVVALLLTLSQSAHSATPTVAVMPFKDLSGDTGKGSIGEAIRETVTSDLKEIAGLKIIERGNIDKVLAEQNLQAKSTDLDPLSSVKIGKLLGATLIVAGAYQKADSNVRLTARFVNVETGEIVGSAKVDGSQGDFLKLQDRITSQLLKSAGLGAPQIQKFAARPRPKVKSWKTIELYGDAVVEKDDQKRQEMLRATVSEDPGFVYASRDLDALERRLKILDQQARSEQVKGLVEMKAKLAAEKDPDKRYQMTLALLNGLMNSRRYHTLVVEAQAVIDSKPPPPPIAGGLALDEMAAFYLVTAHNTLKHHDATLRAGEDFLKRFPRSMYFTSAKSVLEQVIQQKRKAEEGRDKVKPKLDELYHERKWDLCAVGDVYKYQNQYTEALRLYRACVEVGAERKGLALYSLAYMQIELGDFVGARKSISELEKLDQPADKEWVANAKSFQFMMPAD